MANVPNIDPKKMAIIREFQNMSRGKKSEDMLPLILALSKKSNSMGLKFTNDEMQMIISSFKEDMSGPEKKQFETMMNMMSMFGK